MTNTDIIRHRLLNQQIAATQFKQPDEIVSWMVAMQSQEYNSAKWAIGLRLPGNTDKTIEHAFNAGTILRTHLLRPTWHFVTPADIRWILKLTAPRVHIFNAFGYRLEKLDAKTFKHSNDVIARALEGGKHLTRNVLAAELDRAKITASGIRLTCIMMYAELEGIICSGPRVGKQFTYALLEERVPKVKKLFSKEEALAVLALRYFSSRSPATLKDFVWWSGLTVKDAKESIAMLPKDFERKTIEDQEYIYAPLSSDKISLAKATFLMPNFDEYGISYKDRSILKGNKDTHNFITKNGGSIPTLVVDGQTAGTWKPTTKKNKTTVETNTYWPLSKTKQHAVEHAVSKYCSFIDNK